MLSAATGGILKRPGVAAKLAKAMVAEVFVFTGTKEELAEAERLGRPAFSKRMKRRSRLTRRAFILSTIAQKHDIDPFLPLLERDQALAVVGALQPTAPVNNQSVAFHRYSVSGSLIGSIAETREELEFCAEHRIGPHIQIIDIADIADIKDAYHEVEKGRSAFRVIDTTTLNPDRCWCARSLPQSRAPSCRERAENRTPSHRLGEYTEREHCAASCTGRRSRQAAILPEHPGCPLRGSLPLRLLQRARMRGFYRSDGETGVSKTR